MPRNGDRRLVAFLGGTIGNLDVHQRRVDAAQGAAPQLGPEDRLLVGTDLVKDRERLEAAYNDSAGVTASFNRNILNVVNSHLDGDFDPERFEHRAIYDDEHAVDRDAAARARRAHGPDRGARPGRRLRRRRAHPHRDLVQVHARTRSSASTPAPGSS